MKNELDRQLKAQWEAAPVEDFDIPIDTEQLWHNIARPGKQAQSNLSWLRYAAALLMGAMVTFGLMQWKTPVSLALRPGLDRQEARPATIARQAAKAPKSDPPESMPHKQAAIPGYIHPASGTVSTPSSAGIVTIKEVPKDEQMPAETLSPVPQGRDGIVQAPGRSQPARKTIHLFDLEKPVPQPEKTNKLMMAIEEHTRKQSNDIAFSTKILTNQF